MSNFESKIFDNINAQKIGWLLPNGQFEDCLYGEHTYFAFEYLKQNKWKEEFCKYRSQNENRGDVRDFIISKGYILLDNPRCNENQQYVSYYPWKRYSKKQINALYELFREDRRVQEWIEITFLT